MYDLSRGMEILRSSSYSTPICRVSVYELDWDALLLLLPARLLTRLNAMRNENGKQDTGRSAHLGERLGDGNEDVCGGRLLLRTRTDGETSALTYYY